MKNIVIGLLICVLLSISAGAEAQEEFEFGWLELGMVYEQDSSFNVPGWTYEYDETPWVHLYNLPMDTNPDFFLIRYGWQHYASNTWEEEEEFVEFCEMPYYGEWWKSPERWDDPINPIRQSGAWWVDVSVSGFSYSGEMELLFSVENSTEFDVNVAPEPVSSILFVIGGVSLAFFRYRRRKRICKKLV